MAFNTRGTPIQPQERMIELDVTRGLAIFGILMVNMQFFATAFLLTTRLRLNLWTGEGDPFAREIIESLFTGKFYTMFSFLFGVGMVIFMERAMQKGHRPILLFWRRKSVLLGFGLIHGLLIWYGDILFDYAVIGLVIALFRKAKPWMALLAAVLAHLARPVLTSLDLYQKITLPIYEKLGLSAKFADLTGFYDATVYAYSAGSYFDQVVQRYHEFVFTNSSFWGMFTTLMPMMLFGVYAAKKGVFKNPSAHLRFLKGVWIFSLLAVLCTSYWKASHLPVNNIHSWRFIWDTWITTAQHPVQCFLYISSLMLLMQRDWFRSKLAAIASVGRMAITNYLLSSLICTTIFYSYGFGLYGKVSPSTGMLMTVLIYPLLMVFSIVWLRRFRYGPVEWIWRTLTYGKLQDMRLAPSQQTKREVQS